MTGRSKISGETQAELETSPGRLGHPWLPSGLRDPLFRNLYDKDGHYLTKQPEYETVWAHGGNCGIDDLDAIAMLDFLDDNYGLDTIEMGVTIGVAMEAGLLKFGDAQAAINLVKEVGKGTPLGRILGSGAAVTGKVFGVERVPVVKGQAMPAYDPRAVQGIGVTYATSPMGADHTAGYAVATNILKVGGYVDPLKPQGPDRALPESADRHGGRGFHRHVSLHRLCRSGSAGNLPGPDRFAQCLLRPESDRR